ncbi:unnamed protein product, partial [Thlaspi arvense]
NTLIHASCKKTYVSHVERLVPKVIESFSLTSASDQYRPTKHNYKISFTDNTTITKCSVKSNLEFINLVDFGTILSGTLNHSFLVDAIGQVIDVKDIETVQVNGKERKKIEFELQDTKLPDDGLALTIVETPNDDKMVKKKEYWSNLQQKTIEELLITSEMVDPENG